MQTSYRIQISKLMLLDNYSGHMLIFSNAVIATLTYVTLVPPYPHYNLQDRFMACNMNNKIITKNRDAMCKLLIIYDQDGFPLER